VSSRTKIDMQTIVERVKIRGVAIWIEVFPFVGDRLLDCTLAPARFSNAAGNSNSDAGRGGTPRYSRGGWSILPDPYPWFIQLTTLPPDHDNWRFTLKFNLSFCGCPTLRGVSEGWVFWNEEDGEESTSHYFRPKGRVARKDTL